MKIGLEFEGVIFSNTTGEITRWSNIPEQVRNKIKRLIYVRREAVEPIDRYDCLAEVRTLPIEDPTPDKLIEALFSEMELASFAFVANGYHISWNEHAIPESIHGEIRGEFAADDPEGKKEKYTQTIKDGIISEFRSEGNLYRGGGLHINISHIPTAIAPGLVLHLHNGLKGYNKVYNFKSHYRNNLLFRTRIADQKRIVRGNQYFYEYDSIAEYMSYGFGVSSLKDWRQRWKEEGENKYGAHLEFYWAIILMYRLKEFMEGLTKAK